ncbi:MAG: cofactor-independent phosphoglycerate mutase [Bacillota bacterium]|nr:cofactor-independent phosphoglycerate mutase [Bacillota bacterium]MDW7685275.1 cofactor-independent phosphoglycerate mutase [Bacillota bacterium]
MKYVVVLGDGMADYPVAELGHKTPLQAANKPAIDALARRGQLGLVKTVPTGMAPGSDTANLSVLGYNPEIYYSGRSPFEAASMGVSLADSDVAFRCNLVTLSEADSYGERVVLDHSADEISSAEAHVLMAEVGRQFGSENIRFYPGISYRHLMVWQDGPVDWQLTPPHDILGQKVGAYLPQGSGGALVAEMMKKSAEFLSGHEINRRRTARGLRPANSVWIWGEGKMPQLTGFSEKYGVSGAVISAVDLIKGIGICAGLKVIEVEGATGNLNTNFRGKAEAALQALADGLDFVYIHIEAPDECGHRQEVNNKVKAIELIDSLVVKTLVEGLDRQGDDYSILVLPDHATPLSVRTHTMDPVPFLIYRKHSERDCPQQTYDEAAAADAGFFHGEGYTLMDLFLRSGKQGA